MPMQRPVHPATPPRIYALPPGIARDVWDARLVLDDATVWDARLDFLGVLADVDAVPMAEERDNHCWVPIAQGMSAHIHDVSRARAHEVVAHLRDMPEDHCRILEARIDVVAASLMHAARISIPETVLLSTLHGTDFRFDCAASRDKPVKGTLSVEDGAPLDLVVTLPLGGGMEWSEGIIRHVPTIPETIATTMEGRRLKEVLSHPVLDRHDLRIESWLQGRVVVAGLEWDRALRLRWPK